MLAFGKPFLRRLKEATKASRDFEASHEPGASALRSKETEAEPAGKHFPAAHTVQVGEGDGPARVFMRVTLGIHLSHASY